MCFDQQARRGSWFAFASSVVLITSALIKVVSACERVPLLSLPDQVFLIVNGRQVLLAVAAIEVIVGIFILVGREVRHNLLIVGCLSCCFLTYRLALAWLDASGSPCPCLGNLHKWLSLSATTVNRVSSLALVFLFSGSWGLLALSWFQDKRLANPHSTKEVGQASCGCKTYLTTWMLALLTVGTTMHSAGGATFEVSGVVRTTSFNLSEKSQTFEATFRASVDGPNVAIRAKILSQTNIDYYEYTTEGTNSFLQTRFSDDVLATEAYQNIHGKWEKVPLKGGAQRPQNQATLIIRPGVIPEFGYDFITSVWLAYGSKYAYGETNEGMVAPLFDMGPGFREAGKKVRAQWMLQSEPPGLVRYLADYSDGNEYTKIGTQVKVTPLPEPFNKGFTNSLFTTSVWTNIGKLVIPTSFRLSRFGSDLSGSGGPRLRLLYACSGSAQAVAEGVSRSDFKYHVPERCRVVDYSLPSIGVPLNMYTYLSVSGAVADLKQLEKSPAFRATLKRSRAVSKDPLKRFIIYIILFALLAVPVAVIVRHGRYIASHNQDPSS